MFRERNVQDFFAMFLGPSEGREQRQCGERRDVSFPPAAPDQVAAARETGVGRVAE